MIQVIFNTLGTKRPIFNLKKYNITCLLDTGANIPVWNGSLKVFEKVFKDCKPTDTGLKADIGGFGKGEVTMSIYKLTNFELTDGKNTFIFKELYIALEENRNRNFDMLLAYSMFKSINIVIKPKTTNRQIIFATNSRKEFYGSYQLDSKGRVNYIENYIQTLSEQDNESLTAQDLVANYVNNLVKNNL